MNAPTKFYVPVIMADLPIILVWKPVTGATSYKIEAKVDEESWLEIFQGPGDTHKSPEIGLTWFFLDAEQNTWDVLEQKDRTWNSFEQLYSAALSWDGRDASWETWAKKDSDDLTWDTLDALPVDTQNYLSTTIVIDKSANRVAFRIQALTQTEPSSYLYSDTLPVFDEMVCSFATTANCPIEIQVAVETMDSFDEIYYTITYPPETLQLNDMFFEQLLLSDHVYDICRPKIKHIAPGKVDFTFQLTIESNTLWEGQIIRILFFAIQDRNVEVNFIKSVK